MPLTAYDLAGPDPNPMTKDEVDGLKELVTSLDMPAPRIIEIGAERGTSTLAILEANEDAFILSIDRGPCPQQYKNLIEAGIDTRRVVRVLGKSQDAGHHWPNDWKCDLLFVDGDHSQAGVAGDILAWVPRVKSGGIIAFHDYIPEPIPQHIKGRVVYAVDEMMEGYEEIMWIHRLKAFRQP